MADSLYEYYVKITVFWDVVLDSLGNHEAGGRGCSKTSVPAFMLHDRTSQKTVMLIFAVVNTPDLYIGHCLLSEVYLMYI
jgi:hypothetical protein